MVVYLLNGLRVLFSCHTARRRYSGRGCRYLNTHVDVYIMSMSKIWVPYDYLSDAISCHSCLHRTFQKNRIPLQIQKAKGQLGSKRYLFIHDA